ncbi:GNAT family N-acetyltransferase [Paenibacillus ginsengarvi]|uniref:GNAT family N-acetyltransferase n=1 Tax=Paenibacillus ginsengarvi TaxID=400777 RepID=A0A3B0BQ74_9BACL|nr:GNAT family N-acetyltransferase [Paenibacillus ginsengarvi]RKN74950.1 GNAT family N-acetyltransferase [Paenibacillus ginsengarvi]
MDIRYEYDAPLRAEELSAVFRKSGIKRPYDDLDRLSRMIDCADLTITAWDGEKLVGLARAITDFAYCCYLSDLAVDADYQRQGIGAELVRLLRDRLGDQVSLVLLSAPGAIDYYPRIGFEKSDKAFIIPRAR